MTSSYSTTVDEVLPTALPDAKAEMGESFATRTLWLSAARLLALVLSFLLPFLLARRLSNTEFGLYKQAFQILLTGVSLLGLQVSGGLYSFIPRFPEKKAQVAMNAVYFYALVGGGVALWFTVWPQWVEYVFRDGALLTPVMPWLGICICLWLVASAFDSLMVADNDVKRASVMWVFVQFCKTSFLLAAAFLSGSIRTMVLAAVAFGVVHCSLFALYLWRRYGKFWQAHDWHLFKMQLLNALPFGLGAFVFGWQYDLHNYFVGHYFNAADYGIYSNGCFQMPLLLVLLDAMDTVLMPEIARLDQQGKLHEIVTLWLQAIRKMAFCFIPACILMFVLRYELIVGLYSEKFAASVPIFAVTLLNTLLLINFTNAVMRPFEDMKFFRVKLNLALIPVTGVLLYGGVKWFGLVGVMLAVVVARALDVAITSLVLGRRLGLTVHDLRILTPLWRVVLACVPALLAVTWLRPWLGVLTAQMMHRQIGTLATLLAGGLIFGLLFLPAAFACGAISDDERAWLQKSWDKLTGWRQRWNAA